MHLLFLCLSTSSQRHWIHFLTPWLLFFRSVNNLDAGGPSLLSREERRILAKPTNGNLTANCFNSQNENQPPHCRLNGFSAALKTRPRAASLLWADPSQTAMHTQPLLRISSEGAKIKRALFCCYCGCRFALDITFTEAKHSRKQSVAERNWILISVSGQFLFALLSDVMRNVRPSCSSSRRQRFSECFFFCFFLPQQTQMVLSLSKFFFFKLTGNQIIVCSFNNNKLFMNPLVHDQQQDDLVRKRKCWKLKKTKHK